MYLVGYRHRLWMWIMEYMWSVAWMMHLLEFAESLCRTCEWQHWWHVMLRKENQFLFFPLFLKMHGYRHGNTKQKQKGKRIRTSHWGDWILGCLCNTILHMDFRTNVWERINIFSFVEKLYVITILCVELLHIFKHCTLLKPVKAWVIFCLLSMLSFSSTG